MSVSFTYFKLYLTYFPGMFFRQLDTYTCVYFCRFWA